MNRTKSEVGRVAVLPCRGVRVCNNVNHHVTTINTTLAMEVTRIFRSARKRFRPSGVRLT